MNVTWTNCEGNVWCTLSRLNVASITAGLGVYIIWKPGDPAKVIHVGQGDIKDRLAVHQSDPVITKHGADLLVTWAAVSESLLDGVERYLYDKLQPVEGQRAPSVPPTPVNIP